MGQSAVARFDQKREGIEKLILHVKYGVYQKI
jgi:hypothetical protein